jgi:hypothetical protein
MTYGPQRQRKHCKRLEFSATRLSEPQNSHINDSLFAYELWHKNQSLSFVVSKPKMEILRSLLQNERRFNVAREKKLTFSVRSNTYNYTRAELHTAQHVSTFVS